MADTMEKLPADLLIEILLNLPVKSLLRLRCVSKYFLKLIRSPEFIHTHLNRKTGSEETLLLKRKIQSIHSLPSYTIDGETEGKSILSFHCCDKSLSVIESSPMACPDFNFHCYHFMCSDSNGLVCIANHRETYLFNPALREYRRLPTSPFGRLEGCSDSKPLYHSGFGLDPKSKAYKIVHIVGFGGFGYSGNDLSYRTELYDMKNDCWRIIDGFIIRDYICFERSLSFNGVCYWISSKDWIDCILYFDLSTETFGWIEFPAEFLEILSMPPLLVLHESIATVGYDVSIPDEAQLVDIWVMKDSWVKQYVIGPIPICRPLFFLKDDRLLIESSNGQAAVCTLKTGEVQYLNVFGLEITLGAVTYKESLVSVASLFTGQG